MRFIEGLSPQLQAQATADAVADHPEQQLLAYVFGKFEESDLNVGSAEPGRVHRRNSAATGK